MEEEKEETTTITTSSSSPSSSTTTTYAPMGGPCYKTLPTYSYLWSRGPVPFYRGAHPESNAAVSLRFLPHGVLTQGIITRTVCLNVTKCSFSLLFALVYKIKRFF